MIRSAFHPDRRICRACEAQFMMQPAMHEEDFIECDCGATGFVKIFPCGEEGCDCGGWWGILWEGMDDYDKGRKKRLPVFETFMRKDKPEG